MYFVLRLQAYHNVPVVQFSSTQVQVLGNFEDTRSFSGVNATGADFTAIPLSDWHVDFVLRYCGFNVQQSVDSSSTHPLSHHYMHIYDTVRGYIIRHQSCACYWILRVLHYSTVSSSSPFTSVIFHPPLFLFVSSRSI